MAAVIFALMMLSIWIGVIGCTLYGLVLAFKVSILIGVLVLIVEPAPFIIGFVALLTQTNLAQKLLELI